MKSFLQLLIESLSQRQIESARWWEKYLSYHLFDSKEEAIQFIKRNIDHQNQQFGKSVGETSYEEVLSILDITPYRNKFKVKAIPEAQEKKIRKQLEYITTGSLAAKQRNLFREYYGHEFGKQFFPMKYVKTKLLNGTESTDSSKIASIKQAIKEGEELPPMLIDSEGNIMDGHHRWEAAKELKIKTVPAICFDEEDFE